MKRLTPVLAATIAALAVAGATQADTSIRIPTGAQVERQHDLAQKCRAHLGAPAYQTRRHWETAPRGPYYTWMHDLWQARYERCAAQRDRLQHTNLMVAMRVTFPAWSWARWTIILRCETGGTFSNSVIGDAGETSGFQVHPASHPWYDAHRGHVDALYGAQSARRVLHSQGWGAWTCARINGLA